jgi:hypothetical protein
MGYAAGRAWIEALRSDFAHEFLGVRLNDWTAIVVFLGALVWFIRHRSQPDESLYTRPRDSEPGPGESEPGPGESEPGPGESEPGPVDRDDARSPAASGEADG